MAIKIQLDTQVICSLNDGYLDLDQRLLFDIKTQTLKDELKKTNTNCVKDYLFRTPVNAHLIETEESLILIDTGCGNLAGPTAGLLSQQIQSANYNLSDISHVLLTHMHIDHFGGLLDPAGNKTFPNATLHVPALDFDFWSDESNKSLAVELLHPCFKLSQDFLAPYKSSGHIQLVQAGETILPGIKSIAAYGHTPGHMAYSFHTPSIEILFFGDIIHTASLQLMNPEIEVKVDTDPKQAVSSRKQLLTLVADKHLVVGGGHLPFPGLGTISRRENRFEWHPLKK